MLSITRKYLVAAGIGILALGYSSFFLQGLRLFDNDYNQWLTFAREYSLSTVLWQIFNPVLAEWNVDFRPVQTLTFKALFALFEYNASGYYFFKSLMLGLFSAAYFLFLRHHLHNMIVAAISAVFLIVASSTFTSLYWVSDFVIVSEFFALLVFALFLHLETDDKSSRGKAIAYLALMVLLTIICDRTKANGKLIPGILFLYIVLFDWRKLKRYGIPIILMVLVVLPWPVLITDPAPFLFVKGSAPPAYAWQPASLNKLWTLFAGDFAPFSLLYSKYPPISVMAILGFPLVYLGSAGAVFLLYRKTAVPMAVRFMLVWAVVNIAALMSYPALPQHFQARYAISSLVPLCPLLFLAIYSATQRLLSQRFAAATLLTLVAVIQIGFHGYHTVRMRNIGMPSLMIASGEVREYIAANFSNAAFYYYELPVFAFRPTSDGNQFFSSIHDTWPDVIASQPQGTSLFVVSGKSIYSPELRLHAVFPGRSDSWFDRTFNSEARHTPVTLYLHELL